MSSSNEIYSDTKQINNIIYKQDSQKVIVMGANTYMVVNTF